MIGQRGPDGALQVLVSQKPTERPLTVKNERPSGANATRLHHWLPWIKGGQGPAVGGIPESGRSISAAGQNDLAIGMEDRAVDVAPMFQRFAAGFARLGVPERAPRPPASPAMTLLPVKRVRPSGERATDQIASGWTNISGAGSEARLSVEVAQDRPPEVGGPGGSDRQGMGHSRSMPSPVVPCSAEVDPLVEVEAGGEVFGGDPNGLLALPSAMDDPVAIIMTTTRPSSTTAAARTQARCRRDHRGQVRPAETQAEPRPARRRSSVRCPRRVEGRRRSDRSGWNAIAFKQMASSARGPVPAPPLMGSEVPCWTFVSRIPAGAWSNGAWPVSR